MSINKPVSICYIHPSKYTKRPDFCIMPIGAVALMNFLSSLKFEVAGINEGLELSLSGSWRIETWLQRRQFDLYFVEFHWYEHATSVLRISQLCKEVWPRSTVVIGGLSTALMCAHVRARSHADYVLSSARIDGLLDVPTFGTLKDELCRFANQYLECGDFVSLGWLEHHEAYLKCDIEGYRFFSPIRSLWIPIARGCMYNCIYCGGRADIQERVFGSALEVRSPRAVNRDIVRLDLLAIHQVRFSHDVCMMAPEWVDELAGSQTLGLYNEFFQVPSNEAIVKLLNKFHIPLSRVAFTPLTGHEETRHRYGKHFSNDELMRAVALLVDASCPVDIYFSPNVGDNLSVAFSASLELADKLIDRFGSRVRLFCQPLRVEPLTPLATLDDAYFERVLENSQGMTEALAVGDAKGYTRLIAAWNARFGRRWEV